MGKETQPLYPRHLVRADDKSPSAATTSAMGKNGKEEPVINVPHQISQIVRLAARAFTARLNLIPLVCFISRPRALPHSLGFIPTYVRGVHAPLRVYVHGHGG